MTERNVSLLVAAYGNDAAAAGEDFAAIKELGDTAAVAAVVVAVFGVMALAAVPIRFADAQERVLFTVFLGACVDGLDPATGDLCVLPSGCSARRGVLNTRSGPNRCCRPRVDP